MVARDTTLTRKGQITIPIEIRQALNLTEGEKLSVEQHGEAVLVRRAISVAERTAGGLAQYRRIPPLTPSEERAAFEQAVADEVMASMER
ncbi:MAG: AbrB/MazE/SpoVT family DNA-binding domain-containing protein [Chloroflexota bacterium]|nr:AbrB/MazE/SpoVT family DNA-binding domain-containing protein [Chloroflexota bacterium]